MIHYQLRCANAHEFDSWFKDSAGFDRQASRGLIECPVCGDAKVERALMAPHLPSRRRGAKSPEIVPAAPAPPQRAAMAAGGRMPDHVRVMFQRMRAEVEKNCDYVGPRFADEARKIYRGEGGRGEGGRGEGGRGASDKRGIYGETTPEQAEALAEEGIEVAAIPWVPRAEG